ncbi:rihB, partial [Symbiodinium necroappetens]
MGCISCIMRRRAKKDDKESRTPTVSELEHLLRDHDMEVGRRQKKSVLVEAAHKILASSGNNDVQRIIDKIANGEDFVFNHWRCLETPDRAYYTLGPFAQLELEMVEARRLIPAVSGIIQKHFGDEPDAFVRVYVDDCLHYAGRCIYNNRRPKWEDFQIFDIVADRSIVRVHVYDSDSKDNSAVEPLGFVEFCIADLPFEKEIDGWFELKFAQNLQGINLDRYAQHCAQREEDFKFDLRELTAMQQELLEDSDSENDDDAIIPDNAAYMKTKGHVPASTAARLMKRVRKGVSLVTSKFAKKARSFQEDDSIQYNAGEIRLRLKLVRTVPEGIDAFARALSPSYFTYDTFVQEENLPQLDLQELMDDAMDIKLTLFDDIIFAVMAFCYYIFAWRSFLLSGLLLSAGLCCAKNAVLGTAALNLWTGLVLVIMASKTWRDEMTTNGLNAPLDQRGLELVAAWNETSEMHAFLVRLVQSRNGQIVSMQDLVHFAGTITVGRGELEITFKELKSAMQDLWFVDFPKQTDLKKGSLVRVQERQKGTVIAISSDEKVTVQIDVEDQDDDIGMGVYAMEDVTVRMAPPPIPKMLVPRSMQGLAATLQFQVNSVRDDLMALARQLQAFMRWHMPVKMLIVVCFVFARGFLACYGYIHESSFCYAVEEYICHVRNSVLCVVMVILFFCRARGVRVVRGLFQIAVSRFRRRLAPDCWQFF